MTQKELLALLEELINKQVSDPKHQVNSVSIPSTDALSIALDTLEIEDPLKEMLEHQMLLARLNAITRETGLSIEDVFETALELYRCFREAQGV